MRDGGGGWEGGLGGGVARSGCEDDIRGLTVVGE